jgi:hypothetical protein
MATSRVHLAIAAAVGALTLHIPDLLALLNIPDPVKYAVGSVVLAVAYALYPKQKPAGKADEAGFVRPGVVFMLAFATALLACAALVPAAKDAQEAVKEDPAKVTRQALKSAELACLGCAFPDLPKDAADACAKLDPVCKGLAGVCTETK